MHPIPIPRPVCHDDGTVTYWSPCTQGMVERQVVVPAVALAIQPDAVRERVLDHLTHGPHPHGQRAALRMRRTRERFNRLAAAWNGRPGIKGAQAQQVVRERRQAMRCSVGAR
jgi:hypothetical protein